MRKLFFIIKTKNSLSTSVFIFSAISQILETIFYVLFGHKHVETGQKCSHEIANFLKYHMLLSVFIQIDNTKYYKGLITSIGNSYCVINYGLDINIAK